MVDDAMDHALAERILAEVDAASVCLGAIGDEIELIDDGEIRAAGRRKIGECYGLVALDLQFPIYHLFPDLDPKRAYLQRLRDKGHKSGIDAHSKKPPPDRAVRLLDLDAPTASAIRGHLRRLGPRVDRLKASLGDIEDKGWRSDLSAGLDQIMERLRRDFEEPIARKFPDLAR